MIDRHIAVWNAFVPPSWKFVREEPTRFVFIHPTKGYRYLSKKRIGA